ncbi:MAG: ABC transporter permease [Acidobacteriota bacterium]|nr:ABC transporter permease [Acidobacteriota bacterium]
MLDGLWRDLALAARSLAKARAFSFVCVISLGIGMAPVIAIPYASRLTRLPPAGVNTDGLVELVTTSNGPHQASAQWSYPDFVSLRDGVTGAALIVWAGGQSEVEFQSPGAGATKVSTLFVSAGYFKTIGVTLAQGAGFDAAMDDPIEAEPVVILGYRLWQNRLASDPDIIGKTVTMDGVSHTVVGVAPDQFDGHLGFQGQQLFVPLEWHPGLRADNNAERDLRDDRAREWLYIHGQLAPGTSVQQASAAVATVTGRLGREFPATNEFKAGVAVAYDPLGSLTRSEFRIVQAVAFTLTGTVLLIVALNISGMMQVRGAMRERELSIRQAIGASRARLAQFLLSEAIVLAGAGGALASLVLFNLPSLLSLLTDDPVPAPILEALRVDLAMVAIAFGLCLVTSLVFGWLPALRFSRPVIISSLTDDAGVGGRRVGRVHRVTAALQVAIAVPLLVMSGQSLDRVRATATASLGFQSELVYAAPLKLDRLSIESAGFEIRRLSDTLARADGVASVTVADGLPLDARYRIERASLQVDHSIAPRPVPVHVTRVGHGYLDTLGIPLLRGRSFTVDDRVGTELVTVVSQPLADRLVPDGDVIGKRLTLGADEATQQRLTIVGVTADFPTSQMSTAREQLLLPLAQHPGVKRDSVAVVDDLGSTPRVLLIARSAPGEQPKKLTTALENLARELDPDFQPIGVVTGTGLRQNSVDDFLTQSAVAGVAGGVILMLAALGIYGVVGLMVATRTREIAVRAALGASRRRVLGMILLDVVKLVLPGVGAGVALTVVLNRLNSENMGVALSELEPLAYVAGAAIAVLVAIIASLAPARRAASVQPMVAMRTI